MSRVLDVRDLRVSFPAPGGGRLHPVDGVSFTLDRGETLALVGESGCGKSLTSLALLRLVPPPGRVDAGSVIRLGDTDVLTLEGEALRQVRGRRIGMIFQDPMTSLNPVFTVGDQIAEGGPGTSASLEAPRRASGRAALLQEVGIPDPRGAARRLPAPAERRHAAAGDDRDRARRRARDPGRRRADDRARRDGAGADPGSARRLRAEPRDGGPADHPRPGHRGGPRRPGRGDVRRADRRGGADGGSCSPARRTRTPSGLFASVPRISGPVQRLTPIRGTVPPPTAWPTGCRFRPRCPEAFDQVRAARRSCFPSEATTGCGAGWRTGGGERIRCP